MSIGRGAGCECDGDESCVSVRAGVCMSELEERAAVHSWSYS